MELQFWGVELIWNVPVVYVRQKDSAFALKIVSTNHMCYIFVNP